MPTHPEILWAQRSSALDESKNIIYLTINLPDIQQSTLVYDLKPTSLTFKANAGDASKSIEEKEYAFSLDFFDEVIPEESKPKLSSRAFDILIRKKEKKQEFWPRLTKEKIRAPYIKTNFDKWVDEDEQDTGTKPLEDDDFGMGDYGGNFGGGGGDMDFEKMMANMGGASAGGPSGEVPAEEDDDEDEDGDDGPPPLEDVEPPK